MLVIISDLHLTDGSSGDTVKTGAFRVFRQRLVEMATAASWRAEVDGEDSVFKPIERIDLILLGDILDIIRSRSWIREDSDLRPWKGSPFDPDFVERVRIVSGSVLCANWESLKVLRDLGESGLEIQDPDASTKDQEPATEDDGHHVAVHIHYMVGNHDWFFHLGGRDYDQICRVVCRELGLTRDHPIPFPHEIEKSPDLEKICADHEVYPRHGDIHDPINCHREPPRIGPKWIAKLFPGPPVRYFRGESSIGDVIVVDIVTRFAKKVGELPPGSVSKEVIDGLKELDNVRPVSSAPFWVISLLKSCGASDAESDLVMGIWDELERGFFVDRFIQSKDDPASLLTVLDGLRSKFWLAQLLRNRSVRRVFLWLFGSVLRAPPKSYAQYALEEDWIKEGKARFVVYGHTHQQEIVPLDLRQRKIEDPNPLPQIYFNSGTWKPAHQLATRKLGDLEFLRYNVMTYLAFYCCDERKGRRFESWSGTLGEE